MCLDLTVGRREISFKINTHSTTMFILGQDKEENVKQPLKKKNEDRESRAQELCESQGGQPGIPIRDRPSVQSLWMSINIEM